MDIKAKINELVEKIKGDKNLLASFKAEPIKTIEKLIGIDLPDDKIEQLVEGVKAKIAIDDIGDKLGKLGGLFGKK
ncbi:MAG: hypothetical protein E7628_08445 [Ruminococcaceae bacterium]|nr:hypothetical protein [Oscillospiraceae bacterium]